MGEFNKQYDLEDRTLKFSIMTRDFIKNLLYSISNKIYIRQVIRSSSSIGANYIEANEAVSDKDFLHRAKISKKEAKETIYWLNLIECSDYYSENCKKEIITECTEIMNILGTIIINKKNREENKR